MKDAFIKFFNTNFEMFKYGYANVDLSSTYLNFENDDF